MSEQGTRHVIEPNRCRMIAMDGQYEPFLDEVQGDRRRLDEATQRRQLLDRQVAGAGAVGGEPPYGYGRERGRSFTGAAISAPQVTGYGDLGARKLEPAP